MLILNLYDNTKCIQKHKQNQYFYDLSNQNIYVLPFTLNISKLFITIGLLKGIDIK